MTRKEKAGEKGPLYLSVEWSSIGIRQGAVPSSLPFFSLPFPESTFVPPPRTLQQIENAIFHLQFFLLPLQPSTQPLMVRGGDVFHTAEPWILVHLQLVLGWIGLTPGVDGSCGLNPALRQPMPSLGSRGNPSSRLLQEQSIQIEPVIAPLLFFTWVYLEQVKASHSVISPNHSAKCLSSDTLSGLLFSVQWSHPSYCCNLSLFM